MRNFSIVLSILAFAFLVFGAVMSFWITDPVLAKATTFIYGILITVSLFLVANSLPSSECKMKCRIDRDTFERDVWNRIDDLNRDNFTDLDHINRRIDDEVTSLERQLDTLRGEVTCKNKK
jgi:hypothetical protein